MKLTLGLHAFILVVLACIGGPVCADWLYDGSPFYAQGISIGKGRQTEMVAQPFSVPRRGQIEQIGIALAGGMDPNHTGFQVMLAKDPYELGKTTVAVWRLSPVSGTTFAFSYLSVKPVWLDAGCTYYMVVAPGDSEVMGAVAYATHGNIALATNDNGVSWFETAHLGVRVGGTLVPEPSAFMVLGVGCPVLGIRSWRRRQPSTGLGNRKA